VQSIRVPIAPTTLEELVRLAERDLRSPRDQASYLLRQAILRERKTLEQRSSTGRRNVPAEARP
jgi:hypothetical protein